MNLEESKYSDMEDDHTRYDEKKAPDDSDGII